MTKKKKDSKPAAADDSRKHVESKQGNQKAERIDASNSNESDGCALEEEFAIPEIPTIHEVTKRWARTLKAIDKRFLNGYAFIGERIQPGSSVQSQQLRPTSDFPESPLVLEFLQAKSQGGQDKVIARLLRCDMGAGCGWTELARADGYRWAKPLIEVALEYLPTGKNDAAPNPPSKTVGPSVKSPETIWPNIKTYIEQETARISQREKLAVLEYVYREAQREMNICRAQIPDAVSDGNEDLLEEEYP